MTRLFDLDPTPAPSPDPQPGEPYDGSGLPQTVTGQATPIVQPGKVCT